MPPLSRFCLPAGVFRLVLLPVGLTVATPSLLFASPVFAQITPDSTLGAESSQVTPEVEIRGAVGDRIDGGATRGPNLFHSFSEFNVNDGQRVYFANPSGIENILSRVTGSDVSDIMGTLGVDGTANLFLLNPNGIIFGPNAQLDISGSFVASTANSFAFPDGSQFSATDPQGPPLLTMNVPIGLQYGSGASQSVINEANLTVGGDLVFSAGAVTSNGDLSAPTGQVGLEAVTGDVRVQNLTAQQGVLAAVNNIVLEESQLRTTGDLTLAAGNTVFIRDSIENPFLALVGGDLYLRGEQAIDILALNHPQTPFQVAGDLTLVSDGNVSGDAHYYTGGNFSILTLSGDPGTFVSLYDPIISAAGNVTFGAYEGTSLKVEALGSITVNGNVRITGPDTALTAPTSDGRGNAVVIAPNGTFESAVLSTEGITASAAELNAFLGLTLGGNAFDGSAAQTTFTAQAGETLRFDWNFLTNEAPSSFYNDSSFIVLTGDGVAGNGYSVLADTFSPFLNPSGDPNFSNATGFQPFTNTLPIPGGQTQGSYTLSLGVFNALDGAFESQLQIQNARLVTLDPVDPSIETNSRPLQIGDPDIPILRNNPALILRAGVSALLNGTSPVPPTVNEGGTDFTDTGAPTVPANILVQGNIDTSGLSNTAGTNGGPVILSAPGNITVNGSINTSGEFGGNNSGDIISINAGGDIQLNGSLSTGGFGDGNAGNVTLIADGLIRLQNSGINATVSSGGSGNPQSGTAGEVVIQSNRATGLAIELIGTTIDVASFVNNGRTGSVTIQASNGGDVTLTGEGFFGNTIYTDTYAVDDRAVGQTTGGDITIQGGNVSIQNYSLDSTLFGRGNGGGIFLSSVNNGNVNIGGGSRILTDVRGIGTGAGGVIDIDGGTLNIAGTGTRISSDTNSSNISGTGGAIALTATNSLTVNQEASISAATTGVAPGGNINLNAPTLTVSGAETQINANTSGSGAGGAIALTVTDTLTVDQGASINAATTGVALGGSINFSAPTVIVSGTETRINANTSGSGAGGAIALTATNSLTVDQGASISAETSDVAPGGNISLNAPTVTVSGAGTQINANTSASDVLGTGGAIALNATNTLTIDQGALISAETTGVAEGGSITLEGTDITITGADTRIDANTSATQASGVGGEITIGRDETNPTNRIEVSGGAIINADTTGVAQGGDITLAGTNITVTGTNTQINANARLVQNPSIPEDTPLAGGGTINLRLTNSTATSELLISDQAVLSASTSRSAAGGDINLDGGIGRIRFDNGTANVETRGAGEGGDLSLTAAFITLERNTGLNASVQGAGPGGSISVTANAPFDSAPSTTAPLFIDDSTINAAVEPNGSGQGGNITLDGAAIALQNGARIQAETRGTGAAGSVILTADEQVTLSGVNDDRLFSGIQTSSENPESGSGGDITITVQNATGTGLLRLRDRAFLNSDTASSNPGGNITLTVDRLELLGGSQVLASTRGSGNAGTIEVNATQEILVEGNGERNIDIIERPDAFGAIATTLIPLVSTPLAIDFQSALPAVNNPFYANPARTPGQPDGFDYYSFSITAAGSRGIFDIDNGSSVGGSIDAELFLFNRYTGELLASNDDADTTLGEGGSVSFLDSYIDYTFGAPGDYVIGVGRFNSQGVTAGIVGSAPLQGQTYDLRVSLENQGTIPLDEIDVEGLNPTNGLNSGLFAETSSSGAIGTIRLSTPTLTVRDGGRVSATATETATDPVGDRPNIGGIQVNANTLSLAGQGAATNDVSGLFAGTAGAANAGNIQLNPFTPPDPTPTDPNLTINLAGGSQISATTSGIGDGGDISLNAPSGVIRIEGSGNIRAETTALGNAGNVTVTTPELAIANGASISTTTRSTELGDRDTQGLGGDITVNANTIRLTGLGASEIDDNPSDDTGLFARTTEEGTAGTITFEPFQDRADLTLELRNNAEISTSTSGDGQGGNLFLNGSDNPFTPRAITISGQGELLAETSGTGQAGRIVISTPTLTIEDGATVSTTTQNQGRGGNINVTVNTLSINGTDTNEDGVDTDLRTGLFAETRGAGRAGTIALETRQNDVPLTINLTGNSQVSTTTRGDGPGGDLVITGTRNPNTPSEILIQGRGRLSAETLGPGRAGTVILETPTLTIANGATISTTTSRSGLGGNIDIRTNTLNLGDFDTNADDGTQLLAETTGSGSAGTITAIPLQGPSLSINLVENTRISASTTGAGRGGNLRIGSDGTETANAVFIQGAGQIAAISTGEDGSQPAGNISITAQNRVIIENDAQISVSGEQQAGSGDLQVEAGVIRVENGARVRADTETGRVDVDNPTFTPGNIGFTANRVVLREQAQLSANTDSGIGGNITLNVRDSLRVINSLISTSAGNGGDAGNLTIQGDESGTPTGSVFLRGGLQDRTLGGLAVRSTGANPAGRAGTLTVRARDLEFLGRSGVIGTTDGGRGADITLEALANFRIDDTEISTSTRTGTAGNLTIRAEESVILNGRINGDRSGLFAEALADGGSAGSLTIETGLLRILNNAQATVSARGDGNAGTVTVDADTVRLINGGRITAETDNGTEGGSIAIRDLDLLGLNDGIISASTRTGSAGNVSIELGDNGGNVRLFGNSRITSEARNGGTGGDVTITNADQIILGGESLLSASTRGETGVAGDVNITMANGGDIRLFEGSGLTSQARGGGRAGNLSIANVDQLSLDNASISVSSNRRGAAGGLGIQSNSITLTNGATILARTVSGEGGSIQIQGAERLDLSGGGEISASTISGRAGDIDIEIQRDGQFTLNNATISSGSEGGIGGSIRIRGGDRLDLTGGGEISASTISGRAGDVDIEVQRDGQITLNNATISSGSEGGIGGNIRIQGGDRLNLTGGSRISASTMQGQAGDVNIQVQRGGQITLNNAVISSGATRGGRGGSLDVQARQGRILLDNGSSILAAATASGGATQETGGGRSPRRSQGTGVTQSPQSPIGEAGNISLTTSRLRVLNGSNISVSSDGIAGNLRITTSRLFMENEAELTARAGAGNNGSILIDARSASRQLLELYNNSLISAEAIGSADGGNVTIRNPSGFIISRLQDNSDIVANAPVGAGGRIFIEALAIFGLRIGPLSPLTSDINASGGADSEGTIVLSTLGIDPTRGLVELPTTIVDATQLVIARCPTAADDGGELGEFIVSGRGGLPANPGDLTSEPLLTPGLVRLDPAGEVTASQVERRVASRNATHFVEAQEWVQEPNGDIRLTADASSGSAPDLSTLHCGNGS